MAQEITLTMKPKGLAMDMDKAEFALAIKTYRIRNGLTQREAGEQLGVSRYTIIRVEKGEDISWMTAYKLFNRLAAALRREATDM